MNRAERRRQERHRGRPSIVNRCDCPDWLRAQEREQLAAMRCAHDRVPAVIGTFCTEAPNGAFVLGYMPACTEVPECVDKSMQLAAEMAIDRTCMPVDAEHLDEFVTFLHGHDGVCRSMGGYVVCSPCEDPNCVDPSCGA